MDLGRMWSNNLKQKNKKLKVIRNSLMFSNNAPRNITKTTQNIQPIKSQNVRPDSRAYWGTPTWYLFHTIAEKIDNNYYRNNYMIIWDFIGDICENLPCPFCKTHAVNFIKSININNIKTKEGLKKVLFDFHNTANRNARKKEVDISILNKYKMSNVNKIFILFEKRFFHSYIGTRQFTDWIKNALKIRYKEFLKKIENHI